MVSVVLALLSWTGQHLHSPQTEEEHDPELPGSSGVKTNDDSPREDDQKSVR